MGQKWRTILWSWCPPPTCMRVLENQTQVNRLVWRETSPTEPSQWLMAEIFNVMETQKWESRVWWAYFKVHGTLRMIQFWFLKNKLLWTDGGKRKCWTVFIGGQFHSELSRKGKPRGEWSKDILEARQQSRQKLWHSDRFLWEDQ